jgi:hypothetical protein
VKLWTSIELTRLPAILKNGFDNPYAAEITFSNNPEIEAENALSMKDEMAFVEAEIPDGQLDEYFVPCLGLWGDDLTGMESYLESLMEQGAPEEEIEKVRSAIEKGAKAQTASEGFDTFGYACLGYTIPPEMLKLLDPEKTMEALHSGDQDAVVEAIETAEATPFKSLNAAFWVWLITIMSQIFGPGYGIQEPSEAQEAAEEAESEQLEKMREKASKRPRKKKSYKIRKKQKA